MIKKLSHSFKVIQFFLHETHEEKMVYGHNGLEALDFRLSIMTGSGRFFDKKYFDSIRNVIHKEDFYPAKEYVFIGVESYNSTIYNAILDLIQSNNQLDYTFILHKNPEYKNKDFDDFIKKIDTYLINN